MKDKALIPDVILSDQVQESIEGDPGLAEALKRFSADARQAMEWVSSGRYKTFEDAMEALTGSRPKPLNLDNLPADLTDEERKVIEDFEGCD